MGIARHRPLPGTCAGQQCLFHRQQGASLVEFAVVLPLLLLLLVGVVYYGYAFVLKTALERATGNAAQLATQTLDPSTGGIDESAVRAVVLSSLEWAPPQAITVGFSGPGAAECGAGAAGGIRVSLDTRSPGVMAFQSVEFLGVVVPSTNPGGMIAEACYGYP